jgi:hypothetical protein
MQSQSGSKAEVKPDKNRTKTGQKPDKNHAVLSRFTAISGTQSTLKL